MRLLYFILLTFAFSCPASAQHAVRSYIPHGAIFYDSRWKGTNSADKASYYRVMAIDDSGQKMFYDYFITGQLKAEKHYISINKQDDSQTVLNGVCRTFHKSGRIESVLQYKNGKANGRALSFFQSGNIGMKLNYRNGVLDGTCYTYDEKGRLEYTTTWQNGSKVNETRGGKDHYIDKMTNEDVFCERFRRDEALIMAQSKSISKAREDAGAKNKENVNTNETNGAYFANSGNVPMGAGSQTKPTDNSQTKKAGKTKQGKLKTEEDLLIAKVRYPDTSKGEAVNEKEQSHGHTSPHVYFPFDHLHRLLSKHDERMNSIDKLARMSKDFGLNSSQTIDGYGVQKEIIFHHDMAYEPQSGKDKVTGKSPRQIAYFGSVMGNEISLERITIFTWSEDEMYHIAKAAINSGYQVLGKTDYFAENGNFILVPKTKQTGYVEGEVTITFTHQPNLYAGLYHIQMTVRGF